jgi:hypothetical protein
MPVADLEIRRRTRAPHPLPVHVSTSITCFQVSPPQAPAFMASAPPSVPGMPARNSAWPSPHLTHWRAMRAQGTPASAYRRLQPLRR